MGGQGKSHFSVCPPLPYPNPPQTSALDPGNNGPLEEQDCIFIIWNRKPLVIYSSSLNSAWICIFREEQISFSFSCSWPFVLNYHAEPSLFKKGWGREIMGGRGQNQCKG